MMMMMMMHHMLRLHYAVIVERGTQVKYENLRLSAGDGASSLIVCIYAKRQIEAGGLARCRVVRGHRQEFDDLGFAPASLAVS